MSFRVYCTECNTRITPPFYSKGDSFVFCNRDCCEIYLGKSRNAALSHSEELKTVIASLREALESIAASTCCDKCNEASLVAKRALEKLNDPR